MDLYKAMPEHQDLFFGLFLMKEELASNEQI